MDRNTVIYAEQLSKKFKDESALKGLDFSVQSGEIFGFLGPSGSGKQQQSKY